VLLASQILGGKLEALSKQFRYFSEKVYPGSSPLYQQLAAKIAEDHEILTLASQARKGELVPNLFFGAIHFLLLQGAKHPLCAFFPSVSHSTSTDSDPYPYFRSFSLENKKRIRHLISSRRVQTNEVQRCACLLPAFGQVARESPKRPLSILDIGASAGLNLLWDRYGYDYGMGRKYADPDSPVQISCTLRGELRPPIPEVLPPVESRVGIDLNPINVRNPEEMLWLRSLVWPENTRRAELLQQAIGLAKQEPPRVVAGDVLDVLPDVLSGLPGDTTICLFHSHTVYQFPQELRDRLSSLIVEYSRNRNLFEVSFEWWRGKDQPLLELSRVHDGHREEEVLAYCNPHGEWLQWTRRDHP
jgi:hypothetical protein